MSIMPGTHFTQHLPQALYRAAQVRELDRIAIEECGIAGFELMSRAGRAAFELIQKRWPDARRLVVFCGLGNNGGDGYIVASLAKLRGFQVQLRQLGDPSKLSGDALLAFGQAKSDQVEMRGFDPEEVLDADLIVDALLGTGLNNAVRGDYALAVDAINASQQPVLAIDIPTGLCADTGSVLGVAVRAQATITFIGMKQGLLTHSAPDICGTLYFADLAVPASVYSRLPADCLRVTRSQVRSALPRRARNTHKGDCGHVLVIGGDLGMAGAAMMASEAAARTGAGLISLLTRPEHVAGVVSRCPEIMARGIEEGESIQANLERCNVVVVGPGIGRNSWGAFLVEQVLDSDKAVVLDADGLNYLAVLNEQAPDQVGRGNWVLTPHPGEASRLLGSSAREVQRDRFSSVRALQQQFQGAVVLKGNGTLVAGQGETVQMVCTGNPGMASGGMGDVLSGVIGGLLAQGLGLDVAASVGAWVHGAAADLAVRQEGERGLLATDLLPFIRRLVNGQAEVVHG